MITDAATMQIAHRSKPSSVVSSTRCSGPNVVARKMVSTDSPEVLSSVRFSSSSLLKIVRSSSDVSIAKNRWKIENVTRPIVWATLSS